VLGYFLPPILTLPFSEIVRRLPYRVKQKRLARANWGMPGKMALSGLVWPAWILD